MVGYKVEGSDGFLCVGLHTSSWLAGANSWRAGMKRGGNMGCDVKRSCIGQASLFFTDSNLPYSFQLVSVNFVML